MIAITGTARAAAPEDEARAEGLFQEAKQLMAEGRVQEACPKLEEAKRLDLGGGTVLALALCHEQNGQRASALIDFREALALAIEAKRADRVRLAEEHAARLKENVSTLTLFATNGLDLRVNGEVWDRARIGVAVPVDAGDYVVRAEAPGKRPWEATVHVAQERDSLRLEVPALIDIATPPPVADVVPPTRAPVSDGRTRAIAGFAVGGLGAFALGSGVFFGVRAMMKRSEADCQGRVCEGATGAYDDARTSATVATIAGIVGAVGLGAGAALLLTGRDHADASRRSSLEIAPQISAHGGTLGIAGRF
jgi:hypothetical protein